jgi:hypothetical protein
MDTGAYTRLVEDLMHDFQTAEKHNILFYSTNKSRDFKLLDGRLKRYKTRLDLLMHGANTVGKIGDGPGKADIQK